jgi:Flp pilus assembly pilin Flp
MGHAKSWTKRLLFLLTTISRQSGGILAEYALVIAIITLGLIGSLAIIGVATSSFYTDFLDAGPFG